MRFVAIVGVVAVACIHAGAWTFSRDVVGAPSFRGQLASVSYTPFDGCTYDPDPKPDSPKRCTPQQIRADLQAIAPYTRMVRTYSSTGGTELVPEIAREFGLRVDVQPEIAQIEDLVESLAAHACQLRSDGALPPPRKSPRRR